MMGMSQNLQNGLGSAQIHGHQPNHLAQMQVQMHGGQETGDRMKAANLNQQYQSEHLHSSYYHQQQQKMLHSFHQHSIGR